MSPQKTGFLLSLVFHALFLSFFSVFTKTYAFIEKTATIDLSLLESVVTAPAGCGSESPSFTPTPKRSAPKPQTHEPPKKVVSKPKPIPKTVKTPSPQPLPASEPEGPVPVTAPPEDSVPPEPQQYDTCASVVNGHGGGVAPGTGGGTAGSGTSSEGSPGDLRSRYLSEHFAYIIDVIQRNIDYPQRAKRMAWQGRVVVSFVILENGDAADVKIAKSSGYTVLDDNVIEAIKEVTPFPKPPIKAGLLVPITYRLR